ncbi:MAG: hypothetical protein MZV63_07240 [Marinilabiliales bacterium]|nr:hypothetical protein [Marinilabiliales bacterium]
MTRDRSIPGKRRPAGPRRAGPGRRLRAPRTAVRRAGRPRARAGRRSSGSQPGRAHRRHGQAHGAHARREGLEVVGSDYRRFDASASRDSTLHHHGIAGLLLHGVPENFRRNWISSIPRIDGIRGVRGLRHLRRRRGDQRNAAYELLDCAWPMRGRYRSARRAFFAHMSAFASTWSSGRSARVLRCRDLPDDDFRSRAVLGAVDSVCSRLFNSLAIRN